ncbi:pyridoxal phosphate-dependent aminotransferase [Aerococcus urinae]
MPKHGGNLKELSQEMGMDMTQALDFSANINPLGLPQAFKEVIVSHLDQLDRYPDYSYRDLRQALADFYQVSYDHLLVGNGAAELIDLLAFALPYPMVTIEPCFNEYAASTKKYKRHHWSYQTQAENDFTFDLEDFWSWLDDHRDRELDQGMAFSVWLCQPNNPTGTLYNPNLLSELLSGVSDRGGFLLVDESFIDFLPDQADYSLLGQVEKEENLVIIRSLTKFYAMPGLRLGVAMTSNQSLLHDLEGAQLTWSVNALAEACGRKMPDLSAYRQDSLNYLAAAKKDLQAGLENFTSLKIFPSAANFFLIQGPKDLAQNLLEKGIVLRQTADFKGLGPGCYRLAVRTKEENQALLQALADIL